MILILVAEYVGDFLLQDRETALNKSKSLKHLNRHLFAIFCCIAATGLGFGMPAVYLAACYVVIHGVQDWFIWKGYGAILYRRYEKEGGWNPDDKHNQILWFLEEFKRRRLYAEDKVFYDLIGLDRLLHIITLIILYGLFFL